ncbi:MAG: proline dehydrogenase family protein [Thermoleophilia bacterium]|nr:proline dehydrogenase family protein [Thermoleophilia bacterium]
MSEQDWNEQIILRGKEFFGNITGEAPSVFNKGRWIGKAMDWSMQNEDFKVRLFRFVDVFPCLSSGDLLRSHIDEYFTEGGVEAPGLLDWGIRAAGKGGAVGSAILGRGVRSAIRDLAKVFIIGESAHEALANIQRLRDQGFAVVLDALGEATVSEEEARRHVAEYGELLDSLQGARKAWSPLGSSDASRHGLDWGSQPPVAVSVKPSSVCARIRPRDFQGSVENLVASVSEVYEKTIEVGGSLCIDLESYEHKDVVLEAFRRLRLRHRDYPHLGVVLQSYLRDTDGDLEDLLAWSRTHEAPISIRLVKGAYWDQEVIRAKQNGWPVPVYTRKVDTDAAFERHARRILEHPDLCYFACASHNIRSVSAVMVIAEMLGVPEDRYEFQALLGMAEPVRKGLRNVADRVRLYCPYGEMVPGMAYLVRRLLETTANDSFLRQGFADGTDVDDLLRDPGAALLARTGVADSTVPEMDDTATNDSFCNEPIADFSRAGDRIRMLDALAVVRRSLGRTYPLHIDGRDVETGRMISSANPARPEEVIGYVGQGSAPDVDAAVRAAKKALPSWRDLGPRARADYLIRAAAAMRRRIWEFSAWQVLEVGKQWDLAHADVAEAIDFLEFYAREMVRLGVPVKLGLAPGELNLRFYDPKGVALVIAPWNFPLAISCGMVSAALVAGNSVVYKPSNLSAVVGRGLVDVFAEVGLPPGVFNYLPCSGGEVGDLLVDHPEVALIAFTGSLEVGQRIIERAAKARSGQTHFKKVITELGGKNAIIIDEDADLDEAVPHVLYSAFGFQGQKCSACSRVVVVDRIYDRFVERLVAGARSLRIGSAELPENDVGPVIDGSARERILRYIQSVEIADRILYASEVPPGGFYVPITIIGDVIPADAVAQDELFGPVLSVMRARSFDHALDVAGSTRFALTGGVFSRSPRNLRAATRAFRVGNLYLNRNITGALVGRQPFGGFGMSGGGTKAGGTDYLLHFMDPRIVTENLVRRGFAPVDEGDDWVDSSHA